MIIHEFCDGIKPVMVLIHGVLTPWQIWNRQIAAFREDYNIYAVALNGHTEEASSEFISLRSEVQDITQYFKNHNINTIDTLCGLSLGGKIAYEIWKSGELNVGNLVLDGAPLISCPKIAESIMISNYIRIIHRSKVRDKRVIASFKRHFLPEEYLESYLKIADFMTDRSMKNIVHAAFSGNFCPEVDNLSRILFIHGTKGNEVLSKRSAALMKEHYPETEIVCFKGDPHCRKAIYQPEIWVETVREFLRG